MNAKAIGLFDDGDEADFIEEVLGNDSTDLIRNVLRAVPEEDYEYLDNVHGSQAILAAEIVASMMGNESSDLQDELQLWASQFMEPDDELLRLAKSAVNRVRRKSETRDLWSDSKQFGEWLMKTKDLEERLNWR